MLEALAELILETLFEIVLWILWELGLRVLGEPFVERERRNPIIAAFGYLFIGAILGGLSLFFFPESFISDERFHIINLVITPPLAGLVMALIGKLRERRGQTLLRLDSFVYGFIFALPMAIIRFLYAG